MEKIRIRDKHPGSATLPATDAVRSVECWNRLPETVKTAENGEAFRRRLKGKPE
jgi:hypothetical protein